MHLIRFMIGKTTLVFISIFSLVMVLSNCSDDRVDITDPGVPFVLPDCFGTPGFPATAAQYAEMIEPELGVVPTVILDSLIEIPLYQNGTQVYGEFDNSEIDNPSRLGGKGTWSGSALQRYPGKRADGTPLADVYWVAFLRNTSSGPSDIAGSVQLIGYNQSTGATAFFESPDILGVDYLSNFVTAIDPSTLRLSGAMPGPNNPTEFNQAYIPPPVSDQGGVQCVSCHQADPFITNSFINAAKIPGTNESIVPRLSATSPYYVIGGEDWDMRTLHIEGNQCLSCHRVGMTTIELFQEGRI
jgi:hypothetical protein